MSILRCILEQLKIQWSLSILRWIFGRNWEFDEALVFWFEFSEEIENSMKVYYFGIKFWEKLEIENIIDFHAHVGRREHSHAGAARWCGIRAQGVGAQIFDATLVCGDACTHTPIGWAARAGALFPFANHATCAFGPALAPVDATCSMHARIPCYSKRHAAGIGLD